MTASIRASQYAAIGASYFTLYQTLRADGTTDWRTDAGVFDNDAGQPDGQALCDVSLAAMIIDPESDGAIARMSVFDPVAKSILSENQVVSPGCGLFGPFFSSPAEGRLGAMRIDTPEEFYDAVGLFAQAQLIGAGYRPRTKILCYLQPPPVVPTMRKHYRYVGGVTLAGNAGELVGVFPFWGRSRLSVEVVQSGASTGNFTVTVNGIKVYGPLATDNLAIPLFTSAAIGANGRATYQMQNRFFDAITITATGTIGTDTFVSYEAADADV